MGPEIVPSEEIRATEMRILRAMGARDTAALAELFSKEPYVVGIGSDPKEWWRGSDAVSTLIAHQKELPEYRAEPQDMVAFRCGDIGWVVGRTHVTFADGTSVVLRGTTVYAIERGQWRVVHWHNSIGVDNEDALGFLLTTSIRSVEQDVREQRPDVGAASAPDGTVTVMFSDIESSTVLLERLGDADFVRLLAWHDEIVRDAALEHRGYIVKSRGDGFMIAFPSAALALRCALTIQERLEGGFGELQVRVRIGLHAGEALRHADDFYGRTVVIAARIAEHATGGEILVSEVVHELARGLHTFDFGTPRAATLKGLDGEFRLIPILARPAPA